MKWKWSEIMASNTEKLGVDAKCSKIAESGYMKGKYNNADGPPQQNKTLIVQFGAVYLKKTIFL